MLPTLEFEFIESQGEIDPCGYYQYAELFQLKVTNPDGSRNTFLLSNPAQSMPASVRSRSISFVANSIRFSQAIGTTADGSFLRLEIDAPSESGNWPYQCLVDCLSSGRIVHSF